jgi:hypothetical protein
VIAILGSSIFVGQQLRQNKKSNVLLLNERYFVRLQNSSVAGQATLNETMLF